MEQSSDGFSENELGIVSWLSYSPSLRSLGQDEVRSRADVDGMFTGLRV